MNPLRVTSRYAASVSLGEIADALERPTIVQLQSVSSCSSDLRMVVWRALDIVWLKLSQIG
jgi:hypothetical protein